MNHREFTKRYLAFTETWTKVSCLGILGIALIIVVTNLIW
jgi:hypothetical protein